MIDWVNHQNFVSEGVDELLDVDVLLVTFVHLKEILAVKLGALTRNVIDIFVLVKNLYKFVAKSHRHPIILVECFVKLILYWVLDPIIQVKMLGLINPFCEENGNNRIVYLGYSIFKHSSQKLKVFSQELATHLLRLRLANRDDEPYFFCIRKHLFCQQLMDYLKQVSFGLKQTGSIDVILVFVIFGKRWQHGLRYTLSMPNQEALLEPRLQVDDSSLHLLVWFVPHLIPQVLRLQSVFTMQQSKEQGTLTASRQAN